MSELEACRGCHRVFYWVYRERPDECPDCGHDGTESIGAGWTQQVSR